MGNYCEAIIIIFNRCSCRHPPKYKAPLNNPKVMRSDRVRNTLNNDIMLLAYKLNNAQLSDKE